MCIIFYSNVKRLISYTDEIEFSTTKNRHGWGITWLDPEEGHFYMKGSNKEIGYLYHKLQVLADKNPNILAAVHLRYKTVGGESIQNCHPFEITSNDQVTKQSLYTYEVGQSKSKGIMMHNGTIQKAILKEMATQIYDHKLKTRDLDGLAHAKQKTLSKSSITDSQQLAEYLGFRARHSHESVMCDLLTTEYSRFFTWYKGEESPRLHGEWIYDEEAGIYLSNDYTTRKYTEAKEAPGYFSEFEYDEDYFDDEYTYADYCKDSGYIYDAEDEEFFDESIEVSKGYRKTMIQGVGI
mgnify:CR=1 FL=1|jgi:predicted glutamine amidotransferase